MKKRFSPLHLIISIPVIAAILGSLWLIVRSAEENARFNQSIDQTLAIVNRARNVASVQQDFGANPNDDLIAGLQRAGQMASGKGVANGWQLPVHAYAMQDGLLRLDNELPSHECRRLALYFIAHRPADFQIAAIDGYNRFAGRWVQIYPAARTDSRALELACEGAPALLGIVFRFRAPDR